ncbi:hypothetical protein [Rhizobium halophytocola]|uniref:hypothetical protein n=1 Tax=Rhizobium halophytocola TaxID=735519 RepID=UPI001AE5B9A2|nr:hypothetical protein [Rhizobium halophytocola]
MSIPLLLSGCMIAQRGREMFAKFWRILHLDGARQASAAIPAQQIGVAFCRVKGDCHAG